jgi:hypothetical protein
MQASIALRDRILVSHAQLVHTVTQKATGSWIHVSLVLKTLLAMMLARHHARHVKVTQTPK